MGYKVFVSYKYKDPDVAPLNGYYNRTARDYVDYLQDHKFSGDDLNKAENDDEDLSAFKDDTIRSKLKDKIWDSSVTLVLISPNMVEKFNSEQNQWIPWEVAYSLRTQTRLNTRSRPNAMIAVVLPNAQNSYKYFITFHHYINPSSGKEEYSSSLNIDITFKIIRKNMFNQKNPNIIKIDGYPVYFGDSSYIITVKWKDFISDMDNYLDEAISLKNKIEDYYICKTV